MPMLAGVPPSIPDMQTAITTLLKNTSAFTGLAGGPFDPAPENTQFPYVTFGNHVETPWLKFGNAGWIVLFIIDIWSIEKGFSEAFAIQTVINGVLVNQPLEGMTNYHNVAIIPEQTYKQSEADGITRHVEARYKAWNEHV